MATRVRVVGNYRVHHNWQVWQLNDGDEVKGALADQIIAHKLPHEPLDVPPGDSDGDGVPDGPIAAVLEWAGSDPDRLRRALEAEQARRKPRAQLVAALTTALEPTPQAPDGGEDTLPPAEA